MIDFLLKVFREKGSGLAIVWRDAEVGYDRLLDGISDAEAQLTEAGLPAGSVVALRADFSPKAVSLLLGLIRRRCVIVPLSSAAAEDEPEFLETAEVEWTISVDPEGGAAIEKRDRRAEHPLIARLRAAGRPGLVLFSSGSSGKAKAILHDFAGLLDKFRVRRPPQTMLAFMLFDHIGGVNTLLFSLSTGSSLVTTPDRNPENICRLISRYRIETLPTTPTFLNLLLLSEAHKRHDLGSLKTISYGTEVMPEGTLARLRSAFPDAKLHQTYGLSEVGILRSKSESSGSLWVKLGGEGFETRVVDGMLEIKARSGMLGYLNAPSPYTEDGWLRTGDAVEVKGEYLRVLGRKSELINVGGQKVYPAEVESVLERMPEVDGAIVTGEPHAIVGQIVTATVKLSEAMPAGEFRRRMREFCKDKLAAFKVPQKVAILDAPLWNERFKKVRRLAAPGKRPAGGLA